MILCLNFFELTKILFLRNFETDKILSPNIVLDAAEIFLIWTNVAWTNVIVIVEICSRWSQELTF